MINSCTGAAEYGEIIYYSHLIPVAIALVLIYFVLTRSKFSFLSYVFSFFVMSFSLWLLGYIITWISTNYFLITVFWAPLDFINILFYVFGAYFFAVLITGKDVSWKWKLLALAAILPAWLVTVSGNSIIGFDQPNCEALNSDFLGQYKIVIEVIVCLYIIVHGVYTFLKGSKALKHQVATVAPAMILFFLTFSVTEYISSITGFYELNLYSLFVLPVFLALIIYSITNFRIFNFKSFGTQLLVYVLIIFVGSQFFFLENTTSKILTIITFILSLSFGIILLHVLRKEEKYVKEIEKLAGDLKKANTRLLELDKQKSEFVSFATHQLRAPLTAMKGYASLIMEGEMGAITKEVRESVSRIYDSSKTLANIVDDYLNISRIELGTMKYSFEILNLKDLVENVIGEIKPNIDRSGLAFAFSQVPADPKERFMVHADKDKLKQVVANLIDNSVKYTPKGSLEVGLLKSSSDRKIVFSVKDTGVGIAPAVMPKLFQKFIRAENANKQNIYGTGLGLFVAKEIVSAHKGRIWAESDGEGKGSTFYLELEMVV